MNPAPNTRQLPPSPPGRARALARGLGAGRALLMVVALAACGREPLEIRGHEEPPSGDFGLRSLRDAAASVADAADAPAAYARFTEQVAALRPQFNASVADTAERMLVFLAVAPLVALEVATPEQRIDALATTVWPTFLGVRTLPGETPEAYLTRACQSDTLRVCRRVVPEARATVLGAEVWRRVHERAEAAYGDCDACQGDPSYRRALDTIRSHHTRAGAARELDKSRARPRAWPAVGGHVRRPTEAPVVSVDPGGAVSLDNVVMQGQSLHQVIRIARSRGEVLGVHLHPAERVSRLRAILEDAARAGFEDIELIVRHDSYPYALAGIRIPVSARHGNRLGVRDSETIQVLVQGIGGATRGPANVGLSL